MSRIVQAALLEPDRRQVRLVFAGFASDPRDAVGAAANHDGDIRGHTAQQDVTRGVGPGLDGARRAADGALADVIRRPMGGDRDGRERLPVRGVAYDADDDARAPQGILWAE